MLHGLFNFSFWGYVITALLLVQVTFASITIYLHRCQAHRTLTLHPIISHFFRFWLWLTTGMETKEWVAVHRKHHAKVETKDDPHSPQVLGLPAVLFGGYWLYKKETANTDTIQHYGEGTPDDWMESHVYKRHKLVGLILMLGIDVLLFGLPGLAIWTVQFLATPVCAAGIVNGIGHYWGYRNFECADQARNVFPWGILLCGEELHNNHHTFAASAKLSVKWWEFDIGWLYICVLQKLGLARVKRVPPKLTHASGKTAVDLESMATIVSNRLQVLAHYSHEVILPVLREERKKAGATGRDLLRRAKVLLVRADSLLDEMSRQHITQVLEKHESLQLVYQYRQKLQAIWERTTATRLELLHALQQWCEEAQATGVSTLRRFAMQLGSYATVPSRK